MKTKVIRFSRRSFSAFLALLMMISTLGAGSLITVNAYDTVGIHTNATISGNWETTNLSTSDGNHYTGTIYFKGKASGNYEMGMQVAGAWKVFGGYWIRSGTAYNTAWESGGSSNDQIVPTSTTTTDYIKGSVDFYKEYSGKPRLVITQTTLSALSTTVTVGSTTLTSGGTTTIGKTNSGGSGTYTNTYSVKRGSASGTDVTSSVLSGTTFTAPEVSSATTYYVTTTVTDSNTSATATSTAKTITVNPPTVNLTFSQPSNGSIKYNNSTTSPVAIVKGSSPSVVITPNNGYRIKTLTDNGTAVSAAVGQTSAYTYTISNMTAAHTIAATMEVAPTKLSTPSIKLNGSASNLTIDAYRAHTVTLSWAAITNAGSYKIYKDGSLVTTVTGTSYPIERGYSYSGAYTVVAVPSNTTNYSESSASSSLTLTVNKVKLAAPSVEQSATEVAKGSTVTFTFTDTNTTYSSGTDFKYQHSGENNTTYADVSNMTWTTSALNTTGDRTFSFRTVANKTDYYTDSDVVTKKVNVSAAAAYYLTGSMVYTSGADAQKWATGNKDYPVNTFVSKNVYYRTVTISGGGSSDKHYFRLTNLSNQYTVTKGADTDMSTHSTSATAVTASTTGESGAMYVTGNGNFKIYVDQTTSGQPKVWVVNNEWSLTAAAYYQTFNLTTDSYDTAVAGAAGGTVKFGTGSAGAVASAEITKGNSTTLTASPASGYTFAGWYSSTTFTTANRVSTNASYTLTPSANGDYYALFKKEEPEHNNVTIPTQSNVSSITATYNGKTISMNSGTLSVPVGATVSVTITLNTGCQMGASVPTGLTSGTSTFTMPGSAVAINANASKINYTLTAVVSPNYGTLKFYSNSACTTQITTAQYNTTFYAKYTPPSDYYALSSFGISGTGTSRTSTNGNVGTFKMGYANTIITANVKAATPTFGTCPDMTVYANEEFTYTGATLATLPDSTLTYTFRGTTNSTGKFTAPTTAGTYTLTITASNKPTGISTAATATKNVSIIVKYHESSVKYYVDMHDNDMTNKTVEVAIVTDSTGNTVKTDSAGDDCSAQLTREQSSTVYSATINTPITKSGTNNYSSLYFKVSYGSTSFVKEVPSNKIAKYIAADGASREIWLEAVNESSQSLKLTTSTRSVDVPASGYRRIYVAKPYSWNSTSEASWENLGIYYWGDNPTDIGWDNGIAMKYLGYDSTGSSGYKYYYADIPKVISESGTDYTVKNIIFQGWGSNTTKGNYTKAQTGNIENISSTANYFVLSKDGNSYIGTKGEDAVIPNYTRYVSDAKMNVTETANINVAPTYTGKSVTYSSSNTGVVTVSNGKLTPVARGEATITVYVYGTVGAKITAGRTNGADRLSYSISVKVNDPSKFNGFNIMSYQSKAYTVNIPKVSNNIPGYFDMSEIKTLVEGIQGVESATNSAIIAPDSSSTVSVGGSTKYTAFTVKYAYSDSLDYETDYDDISITASVVTKSIKASGSARYGLDHWEISKGSTTSTPSYTRTKTVSGGVETVITEGIAFTDAADTYSAKFTEYTYVDVTFVYDYYEYNPEVDEDGMINYPYDAEYAGNENTSNAKFAASHTKKTHTESNFEIRGLKASSITPATLKSYAVEAIGVVPENNYYNYTIDESTIPSGEISRSTSTYSATVYVHLKHSVRHYKVTVNGSTFGSNFTYQEYAEPSVATSSKWYANSISGPLLATGTSYKFRVKGDTNLVTQEGSISDKDFNRSEVGFSHYDVTHGDNSLGQNVEYLLQNFYIADFFDKNKALDPTNDNLPYDDAEFVGGGVIYYSMTNNSPFSNAVDTGYVDSNGVADEENIKYLLKNKIEENYSSTLAEEIGTEDAMKLAYGQEIPVTKNVENGINTGIFYRYLPLKTYSMSSGRPARDKDGNYEYTLNDNTFRFSNSLQSYQYIYASGNENKVTNNGKNMRLYSYYIYSYLTYDADTNVPETKYEIVLSDQYADASTYWAGN